MAPKQIQIQTTQNQTHVDTANTALLTGSEIPNKAGHKTQNPSVPAACPVISVVWGPAATAL